MIAAVAILLLSMLALANVACTALNLCIFYWGLRYQGEFKWRTLALAIFGACTLLLGVHSAVLITGAYGLPAG